MNHPRTNIRLLIGIFLTSLATLAFELLSTRIFSVIFYYHFGFFAISLALLGIGAGGLLVYYFRNKFSSDVIHAYVAKASFAMGASILLNILVFTITATTVHSSINHSISLAMLVSLVCVLPFLCAGFIFSLLFYKYSENMSLLYFFDLLGAAVGALMVAGLITSLGAINTLIITAIITLVATIIYTTRSEKNMLKVSTAGAIMLIVVLAANLINPFIDITYQKTDKQPLLFSQWNAFSHVGVYQTQYEKVRRIKIDADAATDIYNYEGDISKLSDMKTWLQGIVYQTVVKPNVLIIGPGGGTDVIIALLNGATQVTGVEVNPIIIDDIMLGSFKEFSSHLYEEPRVDIVIDDGRSFISRSEQKYDVILASLVDTWAASASGAFSLSENNLYTTEAFIEYINHLSPDGVLTFSRWLFSSQPRETLRLLAVTQAAAKHAGVSAPERHIVILSHATNPDTDITLATLLFKKSPFSETEIKQLSQYSQTQGYHILYAPFHATDSVFTQLITSSDTQTFFDRYPLNVSPTTDDKPFFFFTTKLNNLYTTVVNNANQNIGVVILVALLFTLLLLSTIFLVLPITFWFKGKQKHPRYIVYFAGIGIGFMCIEIALIQKLILLLGHPLYALVVVLVSILSFSGIGSLLTNTIPKHKLKSYSSWAILLLILTALYYLLTLPSIIAHLIAASLLMRIVASILIIAPLGILMGMPLPLAIRRIAPYHQDFIPWAWAINGLFSVLGTVLAILIAIFSGYNKVLLVGAICYVIVWYIALKLPSHESSN